jgi:hypothetical protein
MIHFDFIVDDVDAENILDLMQKDIVNCNRSIIKYMSEEADPETQASIDWLNGHIEYLEELKLKMKSTRV